MEEPAPPTRPIPTPEPGTERHATTTMSPIHWIGVVAGVLALVDTALRWYSVTGPFADEVKRLGLPTGRTAWGAGASAWLPMILLALAAALVLAPRFGLKVPFTSGLWLLLALVAVVLVIIRWVTIVPDDLPQGAEAGPGFGLYVGFALAVVSLVGALLAFRTWKR
ncbi:hypothetical protein [Labedaea rhizosphaerae]|uniref:Uncharacterized protein n=1 Tax=Labedaea rhizosphaerae TaxID=598644 RepID=A0A4R6SKU5_LABRH|nr:hypothetical protein [Labedaea rhizosphaerae]TDQ04481.1 hypothetical protein EV186_101433 [Labedaea rhizosphaerae]